MELEMLQRRGTVVPPGCVPSGDADKESPRQLVDVSRLSLELEICIQGLVDLSVGESDACDEMRPRRGKRSADRPCCGSIRSGLTMREISCSTTTPFEHL